jgi:hypothetical protein
VIHILTQLKWIKFRHTNNSTVTFIWGHDSSHRAINGLACERIRKTNKKFTFFFQEHIKK